MERLQGRNALVTGAAGGLGHYIARALAAEGVNLALSDLPAVPVDDLVAELRPRVEVAAVPGDLRDTAAIEELARRAEEAIGPIDVLVNNAGVEHAGGFLSQRRENLETILSINLLAVMELTRAVLPGMLERRCGHVVNIASAAGKLPGPYLASYAATKHGVVGFTHSLRTEFGSRPVGFTAICPVFIGRVGMYGRLEDALPEPPALVAPRPPEAVGEAVVTGIRENRAEIMVSNALTKALTLLYAAAPQTVTRAARSDRDALEFTEKFVAARERLDEREPAELLREQEA